MKPRIVRLNQSGRDQLRATQNIVRDYFHGSVADYVHMDAHSYHGLVAEAQAVLNTGQTARAFVSAMRNEIASAIDDDDILFQSKLYLRAARPANGRDIVGWHRESFYGAPPSTMNFWIPVAHVTANNCLQYIPDSDTISPAELTVVQELDRNVAQGSSSHHIGLLYAPKIILDGVDFASACPMFVPEGSAVLFPGELIHGAGANKTDQIRFSLDLRVLSAKYVLDAKNGYFESLGAR